jgi:hypothetical protein
MPGLRGALRGLSLAACFGCVSSVALAAGMALVRESGLGRPTVALEYPRILEKRLPGVASAHRAGRRAIAMLGDSALVSYPEGRGVPERLAERVEADVVSLGMPGAGVFDYYFLADRIAAAAPDLVIVAVNLDHFSDVWRRSYSRPELAGFLEPARLLEVFGLPLHRTGLTADRLLGSVALVKAGGFEAWFELALRQAQVGRARDRFEAWLQGGATRRAQDADRDTPERIFRSTVSLRTVERLFSGRDLRRYRAAGIAEHYGPTLSGLSPRDPVLRVLGATLARLRRDGIRVLVYVVPFDVANVDALDLLDRDGLSRTLSAIRTTVAAAGGTFADLHDRLPAEAFRDAPGHLAWEDVDGPSQLADALAPQVHELLADAAGT